MTSLTETHTILKDLELKELRARFLQPFFIRPHRAQQAAEALRGTSFAGRTGIWQGGVPSQLFLDELLPHAIESLFPKREQPNDRYLCVSNDAQNAFFRDATLLLKGDGGSDHREIPVHVEGTAIELFLTDHGVGILSMTLSITSPLDGATAMDFNYRISMRSPARAAEFAIEHPSDDAARWAKIPEEHRQKIPPPPPTRDVRATIKPGIPGPAAQHIGVAGGRFTLIELARELLLPLENEAFGIFPVQEGLSVFCVARFNEQVDFQDPAVAPKISPFLAGLAQVEESHHAGAVSGAIGLPNAVLNRRHWAAVGQLGAAHVVADQPNTPFNEQRALRVLHKYFIPYLTALLQRLTLHRLLDEAAKLTRSAQQDAPAGFASLRNELLQFAVDGHFVQISSRQALHTFYQLAREGLDLSAAWEEIRRAIAELDATYQAERSRIVAQAQNEMVTSMNRNIGIMAHVQYMVEWIEVFLVSVYCAHLYHMIVEPLVMEAQNLKDSSARASADESSTGYLWLFHTHAGLSVGVALAAFLGGFLAWWVLQPSKNRPGHKSSASHSEVQSSISTWSSR